MFEFNFIVICFYNPRHDCENHPRWPIKCLVKKLKMSDKAEIVIVNVFLFSTKKIHCNIVKLAQNILLPNFCVHCIFMNMVRVSYH